MRDFTGTLRGLFVSMVVGIAAGAVGCTVNGMLPTGGGGGDTGGGNAGGGDVGGGGGGGDTGGGGTIDLAAIDRGAMLWMDSHMTADGAMLACMSCHGESGSGGIGPDIRNSPGEHLQEHAAGDGPHPVKFVDLTVENFDDLSAFLNANCEMDPDCSLSDFVEDDHDQ